MNREHSVIEAFVRNGKRDYYRSLLSDLCPRRTFTGLLAHFADFDPGYRLPVPAGRPSADSLARDLRKRHSPNIVYAIAEDPRLDRREIPLLDALDAIVGKGLGAILSCIPGRLAFFETEDERFILERHYPLKKNRYVRFVIGRKDENSGAEMGIFHAAEEALRWQQVTGWDADELNRLRLWFSDNLARPTSFGRGRLQLGICWFKTGSAGHIARIREMIHILERNGVFVTKIGTDTPGYVIYEDDWQLVAEPFRKGTLRKR